MRKQKDRKNEDHLRKEGQQTIKVKNNKQNTTNLQK